MALLPHRAKIILSSLLLTGMLFQSAIAEDWLGWRGNDRTAILAGKGVNGSLTKRWSVKVGVGHSAPVVSGNHIYQFSRLNDRETLTQLTRGGQQIWQKSYAAPYKMNPAARGHGKGPKSTPLLMNGRIITLGINGSLSSWTEKGERVWHNEFADRFKPTSPLFGTAMSPLPMGNGFLAHVGGNNSGGLALFQTSDGKAKWWSDLPPGYTSPIIATLAGVKQVVTQSQAHCLGFSLEGKLLWKIPFKTDYTQNIVTPVVQDNLVIFSGYNRSIEAYEIKKTGAGLKPEKRWENDDTPMYMSSPVLVDGRLYGFGQKKKGHLFCLDAATGKTIWSGPGREGDNASLIAYGPHLLSLSTKGKLTVVKRGEDSYRALRTQQLSDSAVWAHLVIVDGLFLVKDAEQLSAFVVE